MKKYSLSAILLMPLLLACGSAHQTEQQESFTSYVDPMIGSGGHGHVFVGANVPFGMVQLGPSQRVKGWDWCSGYHYSDSILLGFSHTHLSGTGIGDLGDVLLLPSTQPGDTASRFSHANESCRPGYYKVKLDDSGVLAELTATPRTGMHRYSYPAGSDSAYLRLDLDYGIGWDRPTEVRITEENDSTITGFRYSTGWARDQKIYFAMRFSQPMARCRVDSATATIAFASTGAPLLVKCGLSPNSEKNALANLEAENPGWDFDAVAAEADSSWNRQLAKVKLSGGSDADRRKFYTALYHTMFAPALFSDCGQPDEYTIFSLWDTYRAAHPLSTIIHPQLQPAYARTFINIFNKQGKLPVWHLHGNETDCMIGNPGVIVLADLLLKGYVADTLAAYEAMKASCMLDERSLGALKQYGYIPYDSPGGNDSVAKGLEYAVADDAVARVASSLGKTDDARYFGERGQAYTRYFDPATGFMRGRDIKGDFRPEPFDPFSASHRANDYCEGNGWQYIWMVPQDPNGLIELFGSTENFVTKLDSLFVVEGSLGESASPDISGLIGQYAHGNEPGHHTVYLYNYAGQSEKAAPLLRRIMNEMYTTEPDGLCGNEDVGQMSAWFVLSAMGIYQVEPAGGAFVFGSPLFDSASIEVGDGRTFEIRANGNSPENIYIQSARLNGKPYDKDYIDFETIRHGGVLEFEMGPLPAGKASE